MDAENEKVLGHLVGAGILSKDEQTIVHAAADAAGRTHDATTNHVVCNGNWCLVVKPK
jgi:hypothetical protein